jgi:hypothetical protein
MNHKPIAPEVDDRHRMSDDDASGAGCVICLIQAEYGAI